MKVRTGARQNTPDNCASKAWTFGPLVINPSAIRRPTAAMVASSIDYSLENGRKGNELIGSVTSDVEWYG